LIRTFIDASVLIAAACGLPDLADRALRVLDDSDRTFVTSDFVRLEVLPKPSFQGYQEQVEFYEEFFANARTIPVSKALLQQAVRDGCQFGLSACPLRYSEFPADWTAFVPILRIFRTRFIR
jgi:predicted nucleic acid-binding protein